MPTPAEVTRAANLLVGRYQQANRDLQAVIATLKSPGIRNLRSVLADFDAIMDRLDAATRDWVGQVIPGAWQAGAVSTGLPFAWTAPMVEHVQALARQNYDDLLTATSHVRETTKRSLRTVARAGALDAIVGGTTSTQAGRDVVNTIQTAANQVMTVTYSNGAVHSLDDWADTAVRTQTMVAYNGGALAQYDAWNVEYVEIMDGEDCGLYGHDDGPIANGMVVPLSVAEEYPLSHPRCGRSFAPTEYDAAQAAEWNDALDDDARQRAAEVERERAARGPIYGRSLTVEAAEARGVRMPRQARSGRSPRTPR